MRKTIFTALVTLLVLLAVVSCDSFTGEKPEYTADGQKLATLKVKLGGTTGSRALTYDLAKDAANYMEVIFTSGGRYYRTEGLMTQTLSIQIPASTYYNDTNVILLIGTKTIDPAGSDPDDFALLAIGTIDLTGVTAPAKGFLVADDGNTITFTIAALTTDLYAGSSLSNFLITPASVTAPFIAEPVGTFDKKGLIKCFQVPESIDGIAATITISGFDDAGVNIKPIPTDYKVEFTEISYKDADGKTATSPTITNPSAISFDTSNPGDGVIRFSFNSGLEGRYIITFDIPVVGFVEYDDSAPPVIVGPGLSKQLTWHIRGGTIRSPTASFQPMEGSGEEGVLLAVRPEPLTMSTVIVGPILDADW